MKQLYCITNYFFQLHLMLHACVRRFDVTSTVGNFLGTKHGLNSLVLVPKIYGQLFSFARTAP